jgi:hypothetical protein
MRLRLDLVHQATSLVRFDEFSDPWFSQAAEPNKMILSG